MPFTVECPDCQRAYKVDEKLVGQRVKCKQCGNSFTVEAPPPPDIDPFAEGAFDAVPEEKPVEKKQKLYNPLDSGSASPSAAKNPTSAPIAPPISYRPAGRNITSFIAIEKLTWLILGLFLIVSLGMAIYLTVDAFSQVKDTKAATAVVLKIWGWILLFDVLFFLLLGPLMLLGVWAATKISNSRLSNSAYLRACAVAAIAVIIATFAQISPDILKITLFVLLLPAVYYVLKVIFELDWADSGVALAFGAGGLLVGGFLIKLILGMMLTGSIFTAVSAARELALAAKPPAPAEDSSSDSTPVVADSTPALPASQDPVAYAKYKELVLAKTNADISKSTREERMPDVLEMKRQRASLRAAFQNEPDWADMSHRIDVFEQAVAALPSAKFDNDIYTDSPNADDWTTGQLSRGKLGPEVSFRQFKFQPPTDMKLDLQSSEDNPNGLTWTGITNPGAKLAISTRLRTNARQRKLVVSDKPAVLRTAQTAGLLAVDGSQVTPAEGQINGLTTTRLTSKSGDQTTQYFIPAGDRWVVIQVTPSPDAQFARIVQASARTIRELDPGESRTDAFSPAFLALRLMDDYANAAAMLRKAGVAGEEAATTLLKHPDRNYRQQALVYLKDFGSSQSIPALRRAMTDKDPGIAESARDVLSKVQSSPATLPESGPTPADPTRQGELPKVLADLNDPAKRQEAIGKLALIAPNEKDRHTVSAKLTAMLKATDSGVPPADLAAALTVWGDATVGADLAPLLSDATNPDLRHVAMHVLGALHDGRSAAAIVKWLKSDSGPTVNAMIEMGSPGEIAVLSSLRDDDGLVRIDAARILERIGTRRSIPDLTRAAKDTHDPGAQQAAQLALDSVQARADSEPAPTTSPTTKP